MDYTRLELKGSKESVLADIRSIKRNGVLLYPNYPQGYEVSFGPDRYIVTEPIQEQLSPAVIDENGIETTPAILGDWVSNLVLPPGYDTSEFTTA